MRELNVLNNDICSAVNCKLLLYADDSALMVSGKDVGKIQDNLSLELQSLNDWLVDNKLSLHPGKTESILFGSNHMLKGQSELKIVCNNTDIVAKDTVNYLGADLDQRLSGESMAKQII